jgi:hypothetical protein
MRWFVFSALIVLANVASADHLAEVGQALSENRQKWDALGVEDYDYRMKRSCFCPNEVVQPGLVHVRGGQIVSVEHAESGEALDAGLFLTVDELFDQAQASFDNHNFQLAAAFDTTLGYPTNVSIDVNEFIFEEERSFAAGELRVVPEPSTALLATLALLGLLGFARRHRRK